MINPNNFFPGEFTNFFDENISLLAENRIDFQSLVNQYASDAEFIDSWSKRVKKNALLGVSKFEYVINLFPATISAPTAIFGFLLGLSNLKMFAHIFGNTSVIIIAAISSILLMLCGFIAIYRQVRAKDLKIRFRNWLYLGILFRLLGKKNNSNEIGLTDFQAHFKKVVKEFHKGKIPDVKDFFKKIQADISPSSEKFKKITKLMHGLSVDCSINILRYFPKLSEKKQSKNPLALLIKKMANFFNNHILSNQDIWDMTINNLGMVAGIVGVGLGTVKTFAKLFGHQSLENTVASEQSAYLNMIFVVVFLGFNIFCRLQARKVSKYYENFSDQQSQFILKIIELQHCLRK